VIEGDHEVTFYKK